MKKAIFIYNPKSGTRIIPKKLDYIIGKFLAAGIIIHPFRLDEFGIKNFEEIIDPDAYSFVLVSGGDGTIGTVVNNMMKRKLKLPLGIIPGGTCNDTAKCLGIPLKLDKAIDIVLRGKTMLVDTGCINEDIYFFNSCAGGFLASLSYNTKDEVKRNLGLVAYYLRGIADFPNMKPFNAAITLDNEIIKEEIMLFILLNGKQVAGFANFSTKAELSDGFMEVFIVKKCNPFELPELVFNLLNENLVHDSNVIARTSKTCLITSDSQVHITVDGEKMGKLPISVVFEQKSLNVFTSI